MSTQTIYDAEIEILNLTFYATRRLHNGGIYLVRELLEKTENELLRIPNFGRKALADVNSALSREGLMLGMVMDSAEPAKVFPPIATMTLRDHFAAKAMHALIVEPPWNDGGIASVHSWSKGFKGSDSCDRFAFASYAMADAMLRAREQS